MGLHVSRATLNKAGYELQLDNSSAASSKGAVFRISVKETK